MAKTNTMEDEVLEFIRRRFDEPCRWTCGNCFWFAVILKTRFPWFSVFYYPIDNHFVVGDGTGAYYDWTGVVDQSLYSGEPLLWNKMGEYDSKVRDRVIRDCIL